MPRLFHRPGNPRRHSRVAVDAARRAAGRALDRSGKLSSSRCASSATSTTRSRSEIASLLGQVRRRGFELRLDGLSVVRRPQAARRRGRGGAVASADGTAGRARAADAAGRARAGRPQVHAACHAGAAARYIEPGGRGISVGARRRSAPRRSRCRASCCSRRAPRSAAGLTWSRRIIRSLESGMAGAGFASGGTLTPRRWLRRPAAGTPARGTSASRSVPGRATD